MDDAGVRRDDLEALERALAPAQERVALLVALELALGVDAERVARAEHVDLDRVVDDQLGRHERVDLAGVAAEVGHRVAHRGEVDHAGHAGEVLHHHARGREGDLLRRARPCGPSSRAPRRPPCGRRRRPRCGAGSRAGPSARTAGGRRRTSTGARPGGRSRSCARRPRGRHGRRRSSRTLSLRVQKSRFETTPGAAMNPPRSPRGPGSPSAACQATVSGTSSPGLEQRDAAGPLQLGVGTCAGPRPAAHSDLPNVWRNTGVDATPARRRRRSRTSPMSTRSGCMPSLRSLAVSTRSLGQRRVREHLGSPDQSSGPTRSSPPRLDRREQERRGGSGEHGEGDGAAAVELAAGDAGWRWCSSGLLRAG